MKKYHDIQDIVIDSHQLSLQIDGKQQTYLLGEFSSKLLNASAQQRAEFEVSPSGYGIHWPLLDEDISIDGLLKVLHQPLAQSRPLHSASV